MSLVSGVVRVRLLGRKPDQWRPQWYLFFFLVWNMYPAGPKQSPGLGPGDEPLEAPKNLHPTVPKTGSKIDPKHVDGYAFFMSIATQSHRKIPKGPKF